MNTIKVTKRNGKKEPLMLDKIIERINQQTYGLDQKWVVPFEIAQKVIEGITPNIETRVLDKLAMETAASLTTKHPDYSVLAARLAITSLHKETKKSFSETVDDLWNYVDPGTKKLSPVVNKSFHELVMKHADALDSAIVHSRDHMFDYFGYKTLEKSYLLKLNGKVAERPQYMYMRTALQIWGDNIEKVISTYNLMSEGYYTHATPTLFNSGTTRTQLSSCFVAGTKVYTVKGQKNIEDVQIGDEVVTHKGNRKSVVQLHKNRLDDRKIFSVRTLGAPKFEVTDNHRFWSLSQEQLEWSEEPKFNSIEYLRVGDYIAIPKSNHTYKPRELDVLDWVDEKVGDVTISWEKNEDILMPMSSWQRKHKLNENDSDTITITRKHTPVKSKILVDQDFAFLLGVWLGDGHIMKGMDKNKTTSFARGIGITIHKDNYRLISTMQNLIKKVFGVEPTVTTPQQSVVQVQCHSQTVGQCFENMFNAYFNKKALPDFIWEWDFNMCNSLIEGLITSDGCVSREGGISLTLANIKLVRQLFTLFRNNGIMCSFSQSHSLKRGATEKTARISFNSDDINFENILKIYGDDRLEELFWKKSHRRSILKIGDNTFVRITEKYLSESKPEYVYTLGVEDDHSYVVEGVVAENCFLQDTKSDSIDGIFDTLKETALISKNAGGIGIAFSKVRAKGTYIAGTNGTSNGIIPFLKIFNETSRAVDQCFTAETKILTEKGRVNISDIKEGEKVLTTDGSFHSVVGKKEFSKQNIELVVIKTKSGTNKVTEDHQILVVRNLSKEITKDALISGIKAGVYSVEWIAAKELNNNDKILKY